DERGSMLFDRICELPEYYPTRTELAILDAHAQEIAAALGPRVALIEPGSGSGDKGRRIRRALEDLVAFIPVEVSRDQLMGAARGQRSWMLAPVSGSGDKARRIGRALVDPVAFIPVEISRERVMDAARALDREFPALEAAPVCAGFSQPFALPALARTPARRV